MAITVESDIINNSSFFRIDPKFIEELQAISSPEMAMHVPHVSLILFGSDGKKIDNLTLSFFQQQADFNAIASSTHRYPERPMVSLKSLELKTDLASGYLYYTLVTINLKIHSPYALLSNSKVLLGLLIPGTPLELEYGWNGPNEKTMAVKESLLFAVRSYSINIDGTGQIDLTVDGMAYNERFNNTLLGDENFKDGDLNNKYPRCLGRGTIFDSYNKLEKHLNYLKDKSKQGRVNYEIPKQQAALYDTIEKTARGIISKTFESNLRKAEKQTSRHLYPYTSKNGKKIIKETDRMIKFGDLIDYVCKPTIENLSNLIIGGDKFVIKYGKFNENCGKYKEKNIKEFLIPWRIFKEKLGKEADKGSYVLTIQKFLNFIANDFFSDDIYFQMNLSDKEKENYVRPEIIFNLTNYTEKKGTNTIKVIELQIIDINYGIPNTTKYMPSGVASEDALEKNIISSYPNLAIIRLGHTNSFIKQTSMSQIVDEYMKAVLIEKMNKAFVPTQSESQQPLSEPTSPLILPLRGSMEVVGNVKWKPFQCFYLDAGIYLINAVYKIIGVVHHLSHQGFSTTLEFMYH